MLKGYKYRIYPTREQMHTISVTIGHARFVYNQLLEMQEALYKAGKKHMSAFDCNKWITATLKPEYPWLKEADSRALQNSSADLETAYKNFFHKTAKHPTFKKKHKCRLSYRTDGQVWLLNNHELRLPKLGTVIIRMHRPLPEHCKLKSVTVEMTHSGKYYVSLLIETPEKSPQLKATVSADKVLGLDYSSPHFYVDSLGNSPTVGRFFRKKQKKLKREQKKLSRKIRIAKTAGREIRNSMNIQKQSRKVAAIHEKIANQRRDFTNQLSAAIAKQYDAVVLEDINLRGLSQSLKLGKATMDNGFGMFRSQLAYKMADRGKYCVKVDKFFPSSQVCHVCGCKSPITKDLSVREWTCPHCGAHLNRDVNAAINLKNEGIRILETQGVDIL